MIEADVRESQSEEFFLLEDAPDFQVCKSNGYFFRGGFCIGGEALIVLSQNN